MAEYTTQLRTICESFYDGDKVQYGYDDVDDIITNAVPKIFDFDFGIYDESYKNVLCRKILYHYYTREIGLETYGLWKLKLRTKLQEIMPYYNELYKSALIEFNPLYNVDITTEHKLMRNGNTIGKNENEYENENSSKNKRNDVVNSTNTNETKSNTTTVGDSKERNKYSDTPQGALNGVESGEYLTNARVVEQDNYGNSSNVAKNKSGLFENSVGATDSTGENRGNSANKYSEVVNTTDKYLERVMGKSIGADYSTLLKRYRETFINIDMMVIKELSDLFMLLW